MSPTVPNITRRTLLVVIAGLMAEGATTVEEVVWIAEWCRRNRHLPIREQYGALVPKLRGHFAYYGVIGNRDCLSRFRYEVARQWRKWLSRRHRRGQWSWARLNGLLRRFVLPWPSARGQPCAASP